MSEKQIAHLKRISGLGGKALKGIPKSEECKKKISKGKKKWWDEHPEEKREARRRLAKFVHMPKVIEKRRKTVIKKKIYAGKNNPMYGISLVSCHKGLSMADEYGEERAEKMIEKRRQVVIKRGVYKMENNPNWIDGRSYIDYSPEFNNGLKDFIRQRDNFTCQFCGLSENGAKHDCHHIDYDKKNNEKKNLILLCRSCNDKANFQRDKWQIFFEILQEIRL